jgi:hypothetical protein
MPRRQRSPGDLGRPRRGRDQGAHLTLEAVAPDQQCGDHPQPVEQHRLRDRVDELHAGQPVTVTPRPVVAVEAQVVAQQQLADAVTRAHQITAQILAGADQITQAFFCDRRHAHRVQLAGHQQPPPAARRHAGRS